MLMLPSLTPAEEKLLLRYADPEAPAEAISITNPIKPWKNPEFR
ncbi:hypothetical protein [Mesorhizobium sp.]|nr:hypothetical protein [Mesorhizobium sp.]